MKTIRRILVLVLMAVVASGVAYADEKKIDYSALPVKARAFLETYFGKQPKVREVEMEREGYSVELRNGYDVKFDRDGKLIEVEAPSRRTVSQTIAKDVLPAKAMEYLQEKGVADRINDIEILHNGDYLVEIDRIVNEYKLRFDSNGNVEKKRVR
jgi:hypothetical protein